MTHPGSRTRRRVSRTFARARWGEYRRLLDDASSAGYTVLSVETWARDPERWAGERVMMIRHDVDQHPASVFPMLAAEVDAGVRSSWYFRWRTAHPEVIAEVRRYGGDVGLHYETLSRQVLEQGRPPAAEWARVVEGARHVLRGEISRFVSRHGEIRSVCPHGDSRVPDVRNGELMLGYGPDAFDGVFDVNAAMYDHALGAWLTDRSVAEGRWKEGMDPAQLLSDAASPLLCLVHPNNWASGPALWRDRLLTRVLGDPSYDPPRPSRVVRTARDRPPV